MGLHKRRPALHNSRDGATQQMIWGYTRDGLRYTTVGMGQHNRRDGATQQMIWGYTTVGMGQHNR